MQFVDNVSSNACMTSGVEDDVRRGQDTPDVDLSDFFKRPVKIYEQEWSTGIVFSSSFDPWELFFGNKRVINRINNYNLIRSKLHLKVVLNGNGFQYGRMLFAYNPLHFYDDLPPSPFIGDDLVQMSQLPHLYLNPTTSQGGSMVLPFFYHQNSASQPLSDYQELGRVLLRSINTLKHANGATDKVTISVFAYAEDITLAVPTSFDSTILIPQSGETDEANSKGFISHAATAVSKIAQIGTTMPSIAPYARATEMGANMIAKVASLYGYCRPPVTANPSPMRPTPASSLALTNVPDNVQKLTVDDKQELTLDPRISGVESGDVLDIRSLAMRETFLTQFAWNVGTVPDTVLWNTRVTPVTWTERLGVEYRFPACAFASMPFKYWTGTMHYRFQVVCSAYHKGRLRLAYDPMFFDVLPEYNVNYSQIIDIAEQTDFTISVTNGQKTTLLTHHLPGIDSESDVFSTTRFTNTGPGNGVLQVSVLNELTVPNSIVNNDIQINVCVCAGEDFQVFVPDDHFQNFVLLPQSGEVGDDAPLDSEPTHDTALSLNGLSEVPSAMNLIYTGEKVTSFRSMLKRYGLHFGLSPLSAAHTVISLRMNSYPFPRGNLPNAVNGTAALGNYNYCNNLLLHWVTYAFAGWRGSIRWKLLTRGGWDHLAYHVERAGIAEGQQYDLSIDFPPAPLNQSQAAASTVQLGSVPANGLPLVGKKGMAYGNLEVNPAMEFEIPFYSPARFVPGRQLDWTGNNGVERYNEQFNVRIWGDGAESEESFVDLYAATGEDFQVYWFKGLPVLYYEPTIPSAAP